MLSWACSHCLLCVMGASKERGWQEWSSRCVSAEPCINSLEHTENPVVLFQSWNGTCCPLVHAIPCFLRAYVCGLDTVMYHHAFCLHQSKHPSEWVSGTRRTLLLATWKYQGLPVHIDKHSEEWETIQDGDGYNVTGFFCWGYDLADYYSETICGFSFPTWVSQGWCQILWLLPVLVKGVTILFLLGSSGLKCQLKTNHISWIQLLHL